MCPQRALPLGRVVPVPQRYDPDQLCALPRTERGTGFDLWRAWEISWLAPDGRPQRSCGAFLIPADSARLLESKSVKLYLNSLNQHRVASRAALATRLRDDLSAAVGAPVRVALAGLGTTRAPWAALFPPGRCLDREAGDFRSVRTPQPRWLATATRYPVRREALYSWLFRSLCPVTGQPDWALICLRYAGSALDRAGLLTYLLSYRRHRAFHEGCVARICSDIASHCYPEQLEVAALFQRRGGIDINPVRWLPGTAPGGLRRHLLTGL